MKKNFILSFILFFCGFCFAQNNISVANRNSAKRCLKLAENYLINKDWNNALRQSELGLSYDDSISDLFYVKAACLSGLKNPKAEILPIINTAFEKQNWISYNQTGARIFIADLLCDTGEYEKSLNYLNQEPFIYSADAEFIRIKNYYRIGTLDSVNQARLKINSARRIYPNDVRFPKIFFLFEELYLSINTIFNNDVSNESQELVQNIANSYIAKLPDYENKDLELELLSAFFAQDDEQSRLVNAIDAKTSQNHPLLAILGLKNGIYTENQAFEKFVDACNGNISLITFELFMKNLKTENAWNEILEYFANFEGAFYIDSNYDLQNELVVQYRTGRPYYISLDSNNNDYKEIYCECDFGTPKKIWILNNAITYEYENYPYVSKVYNESQNQTINYLYDDYVYYPFEFAPEPFLQILGLDFFVPIAGTFTYPEQKDLEKASSVEFPISERENAKVVYTLDFGTPIFAKFFENDIQYAYCNFETGFPFVRYVDYDNDSSYETAETFDLYSENENFTNDDEELIRSVFGNIFPQDYRIYLRKVSIDRNANTIYEYTEEFLENSGKISSWDDDDDGIINYQHIKYPKNDDNSTTEETIFYDEIGIEKVSVSFLDGNPYAMQVHGNDILIFAGTLENFYWIDENGTEEYEREILSKIGKLEQGSIEIVKVAETRISVIKVDSFYFCKKVPDSYAEEE